MSREWKLGQKRARDQGQKGVALVEFAILLPLLVLLLFGMVEFGWGIAQQIDLRHKAREALRLAIVDGAETDVVARVCSDDIVPSTNITSILREGGSSVGEDVTVTITADVQQLTGFFGWAWGPNPTITSLVEGRVEQEATEWIPAEDLVSSC